MMAFDSNRPADSGDTKLSEIAIDRSMPMFSTSGPQTNALLALQAAFRAVLETTRKTNYILRSQGNIFWSGSEIRFDDQALVNNAILDILATEGTVNPSFSIRLHGSTTSNGTNTFLNIPLADGEMLYMELDSNLLIDQGSSFDLDNAINGGGTPTVGKRLMKTTFAAGMPRLDATATSATIFNIPLAIRRGTDIWWIPHGIRWPSGTASTLGAIIVEGVEPWPNHFAENEAQFDAAITSCAAAGGGIILIKSSFNITTPKTIPNNTKILGRGGGSVGGPSGFGFSNLTVVNGGKFVMSGYFSSMEAVNLTADSGFTGVMLDIQPGYGNTVRECNFDMTQCANVSTNIAARLGGNSNRMYRNYIRGVSGNKIGVFYVGSNDTTDVDTFFYT
jgi:hypothetical protein